MVVLKYLIITSIILAGVMISIVISPLVVEISILLWGVVIVVVP